MRSFVGLAFLAGGFAIAGYAAAPLLTSAPAPDDEVPSVVVQDAAGYSTIAPANPSTATGRLSGFAPRSPLFSSNSPLAPSGDQRIADAATEPSRSDRTIAPALIKTAPVLVRPATSYALVEQAGRRFANRANAETYNDDLGRYRLVRDIQRELKRAGCYGGRIDGSWGSGTRHALESFMSRVNSLLPVHTPETVQLALLRSHPGEVCGVSCPAGQTLSASGHCLARQHQALASPTPTKAPPQVTGSTGSETTRTVSTAAARQSAGNAQEAVSAGWTTTVEPSPIVIPAPRLVRNNPNPRPAPMQGQMALNGPRPGEVLATERVPGVSALPNTSNNQDFDADDVAARSHPPARRSVKQRLFERPVGRPRATKNTASRPQRWRQRRYSKKARQQRLMRQAFGDSMF